MSRLEVPRTNRSALAACLLIVGGVGAVTACGDDDDGTVGTGGKAGSSGSASGGKATGGQGGSTTGGASGKGGASGTSGKGGTAGKGGTGGDAGGGGDETTGGSGGAPGGMGGDGGSAGDAIHYWPDGITVNGISATVDDRFHGIVIDGTNQVYATGYLGEGVVTTGTSRQVVVAKWSPSGQLVAGFGAQGLALADLSPYMGLPDDDATTAVDPDPSQETGRDIALQSDGKIIVAGVVEHPGAGTLDRTTPLDIFVMRFDTAGMRDDTFNATGTVPGLQILNPNGNSLNPLVYGIAVDTNNKIYVFAHGNATHATRTDQDRYVYRLNADGTLDMNFGTGGFHTFDTPQNPTAGYALADSTRRGGLFSNGAVLSAGYTPIDGRNKIALVKLTSGGLPDTTFSDDGIALVEPFPTIGMAEAYGGAIQSNGKVVTTGYGNPDLRRGTANTFLDMISIRVTANGSHDSTWAGSGTIALDLNAGEDRGRAILALPDDRILVAGGGTRTANDKDPMLVLLDKDGFAAEDFNLDATGIKLYGSFGSPGDEFYSVAQSPGTTSRIVAAAGYAPTGGTVANGNGTLVIIPVPAD